MVASVETYLKYSEQISAMGSAARPTLPSVTDELARMRVENAELRARLEAGA